jgi:hypothetical protein
MSRETSFGRPRSRWENDNKMDVKEIVYEGVDWIQMARDRVQWRDF